MNYRKKYVELVKRFHVKNFDVKHWFIDLVAIELDFGTIVAAKNLMTDLSKLLLNKTILIEEIEASKLLKDFKNLIGFIEPYNKETFRTKMISNDSIFSNVIPQSLSLPSTLIYYIVQNSVKLIRKLKQSCKFFYHYPVIVHKLSVASYDSTKYYQEAIFLSENHPPNSLAKIYLSNTLHIYSKKRDFLTSIIPKIYKCDIQFLILYYQHISVKDFLFLSASKRIVKLKLHRAVIEDDDGEIITFYTIMKNIPNGKKFV